MVGAIYFLYILEDNFGFIDNLRLVALRVNASIQVSPSVVMKCFKCRVYVKIIALINKLLLLRVGIENVQEIFIHRVITGDSGCNVGSCSSMLGSVLGSDFRASIIGECGACVAVLLGVLCLYACSRLL